MKLYVPILYTSNPQTEDTLAMWALYGATLKLSNLNPSSEFWTYTSDWVHSSFFQPGRADWLIGSKQKSNFHRVYSHAINKLAWNLLDFLSSTVIKFFFYKSFLYYYGITKFVINYYNLKFAEFINVNIKFVLF